MKKSNISLYLLAGLGLMATACNSGNEKSTDKQGRFISTAAMDSSIKPGDNFWMYANGTWNKNTQIPETESGVGAFHDLILGTRQNLKTILDEISAKEHKAGTAEQQVGDFFASGIDSGAIDKRGYEPVKPLLDKINSIVTPADVLTFVAERQTEATPLLFFQYIAADDKNSTQYLPNFLQGGLGLPDRDYYFKTDASTTETVAAYKNYVKKLLVLTGQDSTNASTTANTVYDLEKQLASAQSTNVQLRDPEANYNKIAVADAAKKYPRLNLTSLLSIMKINVDSINIGQPGYFKKLDELIASTPLDTWKKYLQVHVLEDAASSLSSDFEKASFEYDGTALGGQKAMKPRWQRLISSTDMLLGDALGQLYVKKYFTEDAKKRMMELVDNLGKAFETRIGNLDWMSDSTKKVAVAKLHTFIKKIGYPEKWKDYSSVKIDRTKYFENIVALNKFAYDSEVNKLGKPVDRTEWGMTPPTINAYYNPGFNEIVFPAGILQFPFFDPAADDAINYGGIGMVIGHEMTHGFDDQGAQYDKDGNLKNWWSKEDLAKFTARGNNLVKLYNSFTVLDSLHINGALTQGENTADFGGVAIAYDAFKLTKQGQDTTKIDGFTPDQRFFLSVAQIWRGKMTDASLRQQVNTNTHSPGMFRVNGPLMNFEPFHKAFDVKEGDKMYLPDNSRLKIW
jgi:putative endopeptidase